MRGESKDGERSMRTRYIAIILSGLLWAAPAMGRPVSPRGRNALSGGIGVQAGFSEWAPGGFKWFNEYSRKLSNLVWLNLQANLSGGDMNDRHCWKDNHDNVKCDYGHWDGNTAEFALGVKLRWGLKKLPVVIDANLAGAVDLLLLGADYIGVAPGFRGGVGGHYFLFPNFGVGAGITATFAPAIIADGPGVEFYAAMDVQIIGVEFLF
jgi:hypothetical protein